MAAFIENPRRAPRIPVVLDAIVLHGGTTVAAQTADIATGGCALVVPQPIREGARVSLEIRCAEVALPLRVPGTIAWQAGPQCGVKFAAAPNGPQPEEWLNLLLDSGRINRAQLIRAPARLAADANVARSAVPLGLLRLGPDEERVLTHVRRCTPIRVLEEHARLPPRYFALALFKLLEKGAIVVLQGTALRAARPVTPAWR